MTQEMSNLLFFCSLLLSPSPPSQTVPWGSGTAPPSFSSPSLGHRWGLSGLEEEKGLPVFSPIRKGWGQDAFLEQESLNGKRPEMLWDPPWGFSALRVGKWDFWEKRRGQNLNTCLMHLDYHKRLFPNPEFQGWQLHWWQYWYLLAPGYRLHKAHFPPQPLKFGSSTAQTGWRMSQHRQTAGTEPRSGPGCGWGGQAFRCSSASSSHRDSKQTAIMFQTDRRAFCQHPALFLPIPSLSELTKTQ